jgi:D-serine deaminase-like pyridoxal phosphate-dependent protein
MGAAFTGGTVRVGRARPVVQANSRDYQGKLKDDLPTPALVLDLNLLQSNIDKMARHARSSNIQLRPHAKTHKCPEIANRQLAAGAIGVCVANIFEAEAMAAAGVRELLITSEQVGRQKVDRLVNLTQEHPGTMSVVDSERQAQNLNEAANSAGVTLNVLLDVDPGGRRTGIPAGERAMALADGIVKLKGLRLRGIHSYSGRSAHVQGFEARSEHSRLAMREPLETFAELKRRGFPMEIMSGGSTGTYNIDVAFEGMTELQVGSYVFMDVDYRRIGSRRGEVYDDFAPSLRVISTVISAHHPNRATLDAGIKAFATDRRFGPEIIGIEGVEYGFGGDEHGILTVEKGGPQFRPGDRVELLIPHCDPTVNLYEQIFALRGDIVEAVWEVAARGYPA